MRSPHRWPRPDFLATATPWPVWGLLLAATGLAALLAVGVVSWSMQAELDRLADGTPSSRPRPLQGAGEGASAPAGTETDADARHAARRIVTALDHPWGRIFAAVEASTPEGVHWLSFDHAQGGGELRLEGEAGDVAAALRIVDRLSARPGWRDVALIRWQRPEAAEAARGSTAIRFAVEARLVAGDTEAGRLAGGP
jgi:hypothetical protein